MNKRKYLTLYLLDEVMSIMAGNKTEDMPFDMSMLELIVKAKTLGYISYKDHDTYIEYRKKIDILLNLLDKEMLFAKSAGNVAGNLRNKNKRYLQEKLMEAGDMSVDIIKKDQQ
jgi:hypothetical protein